MKNYLKVCLALLTVLMLTLSLYACGECEHSFAEGVCTLCGEKDPEYNPPCSHRYTEGICELCGEECGHSFVSSACTECGYVCTHSYADGVCSVCGTLCHHTYVGSVCAVCGTPCKHSFTEGVCGSCGAEDPDYIPADGGISLYNEIVEKYKYLILYKYVNEELPPYSGGGAFYMDPLYEVVGRFDPTDNFGYSYRDLDGDGYVELILTENTSRLHAMFTVKNEAPALVKVFEQGMGYLTSDGTVFFNTKRFADEGGQIFLGNHITNLSDGELVGISYGWEDSDGDYSTQGDDVYYLISKEGERIILDSDGYNEIKALYSYYWEYPTRLTKLAGLRFNAALTVAQITDKVADFSTYDGIIETFKVMHNEVTGGRIVGSWFIGGHYDLGMTFKTDEDFEIYNRLLAACALVFKNERAEYGFAKSDLNGDGAEELILLDSGYNLLAIFTEVDGEAVLLDSYNDRRTAFVDKDGRIHVQEIPAAGYEGDADYYVYEIKNGGLVAELSIGIRYSYDGGAVLTFEILESGAADIERAAWDSLYDEFCADLGEGEFSQYTKENAGLTFTSVMAA